MKLSQQSQSQVEKAISEAVSKYCCGTAQTTVTDIHLQPIQSSGELIIFDDDDDELVNIVIDEWSSYDGDNFNRDVERFLTNTLSRMKEKGLFENVSILMPYSFVLVDEDKETLSELLLVDDDTLLLNEELLKGLDEELDAFLKDLLEK